MEELDEDERWQVVPKAPTIIRTEKIRFEETGTENRVKMEMSAWGRFTVVNPKVKENPPAQVNVDNHIEPVNDLFSDDDDDDLPF